MSRSFRASLILLLVALGTGLAAVAGWRYARVSSPVQGPIVLVSIEALRADRVGVTGRRSITPAIDALAADGVLFERAYTHTPQNLPAHVSLLSGRLPVETGVRDDVAPSVPATTRLLSQMLADRGYATGGIVSSFTLRKDTGLSRGFSFFDDALPDSQGSAPPIVHRDGAEAEAAAERWLSAAATSRAFLFLHLAEPHAPYAPPARFSDLQPYDGEVAYADEIIGRLVAYLKTQQLYDQATIIVVGAQGESLGAHGERTHGLLVFDDTLRVPLVVKPAASEGMGRRVATIVQHVDIVPTVLDLAKAPVPEELPGRSLRPLIDGGTLPDRVVYSESLFAQAHFGWAPLTTATDGRFRYVGGPQPALYDTETDPASSRDVSADHPETVATLRDVVRSIEDAPAARLDARGEMAVGERERFLTMGLLGPRVLAPEMHEAAIDSEVDPHAQAPLVDAYRSAIADIGARQWNTGLDRLRALADRAPQVPGLWAALAALAGRADRHDLAADAYRKLVAAGGPATEARLGLSQALFRARRLDDAKRHAELAAESSDAPVRAKAHALLARIAVARKEPHSAREEAQQVAETDAASPFPAYIEGRLLMDRGAYAEAMDQLDEALAIVTRTGAEPLEELFLLRGDALSRLDRSGEAEDAYLAELEHFPESTRAMGALASLYHEQQRRDEAVALLARMVETVGTADAYETAARLWTTFGEPERAAEVRREARRSLSPHTPATHQ